MDLSIKAKALVLSSSILIVIKLIYIIVTMLVIYFILFLKDFMYFETKSEDNNDN